VPPICTYGAKRVPAELVLGRGIKVGHNAVLMQRAGIVGRTGARKRSMSGAPTADDLIDWIFVRDRPNELWMTDITEHLREPRCAAQSSLYACRPLCVRPALDPGIRFRYSRRETPRRSNDK
jgi:hypothetical protein